MLSDERILEIAGSRVSLRTNYDEDGYVFDKKRFARAIEREATAPLIEQIKEDEVLMRSVFSALEESRDDIVSSLNNLEHGRGYPSYDRRIQRVTEQLSQHDAAINALRQRLEAKT